MDVKCPSCQAEYEFDDALVSAKGTTVRCTNCSHQFRVRREGGGPAPDDRWIVTKGDGTERVFLSLRELQRAILGRELQRSDMLTRGEGPPRALGSIPELEAFFQGRVARASGRPSAPPPAVRDSEGKTLAKRRPSEAPAGTHTSVIMNLATLRESPGGRSGHGAEVSRNGLTPARESGEMVSASDLERAQDSEPELLSDSDAEPVSVPDAPPSDEELTRRRVPPSEAYDPRTPRDDAAYRARQATLVGMPPMRDRAPSIPPPLPPTRPSLPQLSANRPSTSQLPLAPVASEAPPRLSGEMRAPFKTLPPTSHLPPPTISIEASQSGAAKDRPSSRGRAGMADVPPPRGRGLGWVVGAGVVAAAGWVAWRAWGPPADARDRDVRASEVVPSASAAPVADARAQELLLEGERALLSGDVELAKERFDQAHVLAASDRRVQFARARIAVLRADQAWLAVRIARAASDEARVAERALGEAAGRARRAMEELGNVETADGPPLGARITGLRVDVARISGDLAAARAASERLSAESDPAVAYALGALELAAVDGTVPPLALDRLQRAAAAEGNLGQARATLVYATARAGDGPAARKEWERLALLPHPHPLLAGLRTFVDRAGSGEPMAADAGALSTQLRGAAAGRTTAREPAPPRPAVVAAAPQGEPVARPPAPGDRERATYEARLAKNPADSEALAGLGEVARKRGDYQMAQTHYRQALAVNPSYLPARLGLADLQWDLNDRVGAMRSYKEIVDRYPEGSYPAHVRRRLEGAASNAAPSAPVGTPAGEEK